MRSASLQVDSLVGSAIEVLVFSVGLEAGGKESYVRVIREKRSSVLKRFLLDSALSF